MTLALKNQLEQEVLDLIKKLDGLEPGTDEHRKAVEDIQKLTTLLNENSSDNKQMLSEIFKSVCGLAASGLSALIFVGCFTEGLQFEKEGVFCSTMVKNLGSHMSSLLRKVF